MLAYVKEKVDNLCQFLQLKYQKLEKFLDNIAEIFKTVREIYKSMSEFFNSVSDIFKNVRNIIKNNGKNFGHCHHEHCAIVLEMRVRLQQHVN